MNLSLSSILQWLFLLGSSVAGGKIITAVARRRGARADAAETLGDAASKLGALSLEQATAAHSEAMSARLEAATARRDMVVLQEQVGNLTGQVARLTSELDSLLARMRAWRAEILRPGTTLDIVRMMVGTDPNANGR